MGINPEVERVVPHHPEHQPVAEYAGLAEHTPHCDVTERGKLLTQEFGKAIAGDHPPSLVLAGYLRRNSRLLSSPLKKGTGSLTGISIVEAAFLTEADMVRKSKIIAGLRDAVRYARGDHSRGKVYRIEVGHPLDVRVR